MKNGWEIKKFGEIAEFERGLTYTKSDEVDFSTNVVLRSNNVDLIGSKLDFTELKYINDKIKIPANKKVSKGSLIICTANGSKSHLGKVALIDDDYNFAFGGFMGLIKPDKQIISKYLFYLMISESYKKFISELSDGANINNLKFSQLKDFLIPFPSLPEQQQIVSILDKCFDEINQAKENINRNLQNIKDLFESKLKYIFTSKGDNWKEAKISEVCELKPQKKEARNKLKDSDLVTFLPMEDLGVLNKEIIGVKEKHLKDVVGSYTYFANNDVLLAKITPCFENGKIGIARNLINGIGFGSSEYMVFRSKGYIFPDFLYYFLSRNELRKEGRKLMTGAVGHKRVSKDWIENYLIPFPNIEIQQQIVNQLDTLSLETKELEQKYQQKLDNLDDLKKSILQKAFNGELKTL